MTMTMPASRSGMVCPRRDQNVEIVVGGVWHPQSAQNDGFTYVSCREPSSPAARSEDRQRRDG
jgi:hypothetical protein